MGVSGGSEGAIYNENELAVNFVCWLWSDGGGRSGWACGWIAERWWFVCVWWVWVNDENKFWVSLKDFEFLSNFDRSQRTFALKSATLSAEPQELLGRRKSLKKFGNAFAGWLLKSLNCNRPESTENLRSWSVNFVRLNFFVWKCLEKNKILAS